MNERKSGSQHSSTIRAICAKFKGEIPHGLVDQLKIMVVSGYKSTDLSGAMGMQRDWLVRNVAVEAELIAIEQTMRSSSIEGYLYFLKEWPEGILRREVENYIDELAWDQARSIRTIGAYEDYIQNISFGKHVSEAKRQVAKLQVEYEEKKAWQRAKKEELERLRKLKQEEESWRKAKSAGTEYSLRKFIKQWPGGRFNNEARRLLKQIAADRRAWQKAKALNTMESYQGYLGEWPEGLYAEEAQLYIQHYEAWQKAKSADSPKAYKEYLKAWPSGMYIHDAQKRLAELAKEHAWRRALEAGTADMLYDFVKDFPDSVEAKAALQKIQMLECEDNWREIDKSNSYLALSKFLSDCATSPHYDEAQQRVHSLERRRLQSKVFRVLGSIFVVGLLLVAMYKRIAPTLITVKGHILNELHDITGIIGRFERLLGFGRWSISESVFWFAATALLLVGVFYAIVALKVRNFNKSYYDFSLQEHIEYLRYKKQLGVAGRAVLLLILILAADIFFSFAALRLTQPVVSAALRLKRISTVILSPAVDIWSHLTHLGTSSSTSSYPHINIKPIRLGGEAGQPAIGNNIVVIPRIDGYVYAYNLNNSKLTKYDLFRKHPNSRTELLAATYGNGKFVVTGKNGYIYTYSGHSAWKSSNEKRRNYLHGAVFGNGKFVAVGVGTVLVSKDGADWRVVEPDSINQILSISWAHNTFYMIAEKMGGLVIHTSNDGIEWHNRAVRPFTESSGGKVVYCNRKYIALINDYDHSYLWISKNGTDWHDDMKITPFRIDDISCHRNILYGISGSSIVASKDSGLHWEKRGSVGGNLHHLVAGDDILAGAGSGLATIITFGPSEK